MCRRIGYDGLTAGGKGAAGTIGLLGTPVIAAGLQRVREALECEARWSAAMLCGASTTSTFSTESACIWWGRRSASSWSCKLAARSSAWLHASAGVQMDVIAGALELTSDLFTKFADETAAPSTRLIERNGQRVSERFANTGSARVIGAEWLLRLRPGRVPFFAWLSYTFQQAERRDGPGAPWYTSPWDQTHLLTFVAGALLPRGWEVGLRVRYTTGSPEPRVTGALYDSDHDVSLTWVDTLRPGRMPDFFMLDARVAKRFRWGPVAMQVILEVLNATNQANVESRVYSYDRRSSVPVTGMPIIPNVGLRAEY